MLIDGPYFKYTPRRDAVAVRPAAFFPWATRTLRPGASRTEAALNVDPLIGAATPFTSALTTPAPTVPLTGTVSCAETNPSSGTVIEMDGSPVTRCRVIVTGVRSEERRVGKGVDL